MSAPDTDRWARIVQEIAITLRAAPTTHLSFVLNESEEQSKAVDYDWHSILSEYLDDSERSEIITGLRDAGFAVTVYEGERAFLAAVSDGKWGAIQFPSKYVFNTTGSGIGRARTSLVPSFCDLCRISLCSADGLTAALLENKFYTFKLLEGLGLPVPRTMLYDPRYGWITAAPDAGELVICKPCFECSSLGIDGRSIFRYEDSQEKFIQQMGAAFKQPIIVQEFISGYEVEVPVFPCPDPISPSAVGIQVNDHKLLGERVLSNEMIVSGDYDFFDYAEIDSAQAETLKATAEAAYRALGFSGLVRMDYRIGPNGRICFTDLNTPPHITTHSSCCFAFTNAGLKYTDLMAMVVTVGRINAES